MSSTPHETGGMSAQGADVDIPPVTDFATDWDVNDAAWRTDPYPIWEDLRARCPMGYSARFNEGVWMPLHFDDVVAIAQNPGTFSNRHNGLRRGGTVTRSPMPPINSDPPEHHEIRRLLLPFFSPKRIEIWREHIEADCRARAAAIAARGSGDAAVDYAQHIPVGAIAAILGISPDDGDLFRGWIDDIVGVGANDATSCNAVWPRCRRTCARSPICDARRLAMT